MRPVALLVLAVLLALVGAPSAAAQPLVAVPGGTTDELVQLVVQVPEGTGRPDGTPAFSASVDGVPQQVTAEPVVSERMAMGLVVDTSAEGGAVLQAGLGGVANFVLAAPPSARTTLVTGSTPPTVDVPWPAAPTDILRGLSSLQAGGARSTAAALDLAVAQLPAEAGEAGKPRLVVLFTSAPDAGGEPAPVLVERMRSAGVVVAVVSTAGEAASGFWTAVAAGTGGVAVDAAPADVIPAFDRVTSALDRSFLMTFPTPTRLPTTATVGVETGSGTLTSQVAVPPVPPRPDPGPSTLAVVAMGGFVAVVLAASTITLLRRRAGPNAPSRPAPEQPRRPAPVQQIWNIPTRLDASVDRQPVLADMAAAVQQGRPVWLRPHPDITGLGMTTTMIEFAHRHRDRYDVAWWIPALDPDLVPDRLAELAEALGLAAATDPADRATAALLEALRHRCRWLLVLDDAGSPRQLARYLPEGPGDVLVASSDPGWGELARQVTVPAFTRAESVSLLRSRRPDLPLGAADRVAATLGDLPLAVGPASAFLADTATDVDTVCTRLPDARSRDVGASVWTASWDRLAVDQPQALALLTLAAWVGPAPMPLSLVAAHPDALPEPLATAARTPELADHAETLRRRGLARITADAVHVHPAAAQLLVARTRDDHVIDGGWAAIAVRLLRAAMPDGPAEEPDNRPTWRGLLPHVLAATDPARRLDVVAEDVSWLLRQAGLYLETSGREKAARALLEDAHEFDMGARLRAAGES